MGQSGSSAEVSVDEALKEEAAARRRTLFHLWWHPHNFGVDLQENLAFLRDILDHFRTLQDRYGMRSMTMAALADEVLHAHVQGGVADQ